jgi:hypothetical protein
LAILLNEVQVAHSCMTAAEIVVGLMGVLMPLRPWWHTKATTVGIPSIGDWLTEVSSISVHLLQWVVSAAGMELRLGGTVAPERV